MIFELDDTSKAEGLFRGIEDTSLISCLQKVMGKVYVTDTEAPRSAMAVCGDFAFYGGEPSEELVSAKPKGFVVMVPNNKEWAELIEKRFPGVEKDVRFATRKDTKFDREKLRAIADSLPEGYELKRIDGDIYDMCLENGLYMDGVAHFGSKERYLELGRGMVIMKDGRIAASASSYSAYRGGIEIEIDTAEDERRKGLASALCASLILDCLDSGLYPSWDAANAESLHLAQKLGYEFAREYTCYYAESKFDSADEEREGEEERE